MVDTSISFIHLFIRIQPLEAGLAGTRAQSCDRYGSGTLHPGHVLGGSLPLLSPDIYVYIYNLLHKDQLHVSALDNGHLQVEIEKT